MGKLKTFIRCQFFQKHFVIYLVVPILVAFGFLVNNDAGLKLFQEGAINTTITIIGIIGGVLLNFLAILLTSNSIVIAKCKDAYDKENLYGQVDTWTKNSPENKPVNLYDFVYYKIFFLIGLSLVFIMLYLSYFLWIHELIKNIDFIPQRYVSGFLTLVKGTYIFLTISYFINFGHLIYKLYYLFHKDSIVETVIDLQHKGKLEKPKNCPFVQVDSQKDGMK